MEYFWPEPLVYLFGSSGSRSSEGRAKIEKRESAGELRAAEGKNNEEQSIGIVTGVTVGEQTALSPRSLHLEAIPFEMGLWKKCHMVKIQPLIPCKAS